MARLPRYVLPPSGIYHVTNRGVDRCDIVRDDRDRQLLVALLRREGRAFRWRCHVFTVMDNHLHVLVETQLDRLSAGAHRIFGTYARRFNERHGRVGHLFQGRFHAKVVRDDEHLENTIHYIWNNPVRADLCAEAKDWPWSGQF